MLGPPDRPGPRPSIQAPPAAGGAEPDDDAVGVDDDWVDEPEDDAEAAEAELVDEWVDADPDDDDDLAQSAEAGSEWEEEAQEPGESTRAYATFDDRGDRYDDDEYDDDLPPVPPARSSRPPNPPGPPRKPPRVPRAVVLKQRRRRRRFLVGMTFFLSASVTLVGSGAVYLQYRLGQIPRVDVPSLVEDREGEIMNVLLVGSDSRDRLEGKEALQAGKGQVSGQRSDTIMVLHIDPEQEQAAILSIPRDLYLPIAGEGYSDRVNAAFALGGAAGLIDTVQESLGITINHYVEVDFVGFKDIVDAVGGVNLYLTNWVRDFTSGLDLHEIGCVNVDGTQGLAWVRSRNLEYLLEDGLTWVPDPRADLGRIERQQDFIRRMLKKALSSGLTNPIQLNRLIGIGVRDVTLDETLSTKDITALARRFNNLDADSVALFTLPTSPADIDGASVLLLREDEAQAYVDRINGVAGATIPPPPTQTAPTTTVLDPVEAAGIDVRVLNGEGTPGAAGRAATALADIGFTVAGTGDAPATGRTTIRHPADALEAAGILERALAGGADLVVDETVTGADLVLVLGTDYDGLTEGEPGGGPAGAAGPTTTVPTQAFLYPDDVEVRVLNGEGTPGAAAEAATALRGAGFVIDATGDATEISRTTIRHRSDALAAAQLLDRALVGGADLVVDDTVTGADLVLVLGTDYSGLTVGPVIPVPRPSTTATTTPSATGAGATTTSTLAAPPTAPPTTLGPTTLPPGVSC